MAEDHSSERSIADFGGDYTSAAPEVSCPKKDRTKFLVVFMSVVASLALLFSGLSIQRTIQQSRDRAARELQEAKDLAIHDCLQTNVLRRSVYEPLATLAVFSIQNRPNQEPSPLVTRYVDYLNDAFEPLNCDINSPDFAIDTTPPEPLDFGRFLEGSPYD